MTEVVFVFWLVIVGAYGDSEFMPIPYSSQETCKWAAQSMYDLSGRGTYCLPMPASDVETWGFVTNGRGSSKGYVK